MAKSKSQIEEQDAEVMIESAIGRTEAFIMQNGRSLLIALSVIVIVVGGFFGYKYLVQVPRAEKASAAMFVAEQLFAQDLFDVALEGDGMSDGFLAVIDQYGSTPEGNLAQHYAGVCYMQMGEYETALDYLKSYKATSGLIGSMIDAQNQGLQGDAYLQLGNSAAAIAAYEKAIKVANMDVLLTPYYLKKAGLVYESLGESAQALAAYKRISTEFMGSIEARDIQKYIGRIEQL